ncbi:MAG: hypothetical protein WB930_20725, partial [Syntrophobacteraceae bacterium]
GHSQKIVPGLETFSQVRNVSPDLNEVKVRGQGSPSFSASFGTHLNAILHDARLTPEASK